MGCGSGVGFFRPVKPGYVLWSGASYSLKNTVVSLMLSSLLALEFRGSYLLSIVYP